MADEVPQAVEEDEDAPVAEEKSGFGFQLSESIVHAIDRQIVSSGLRLILFLPGFAAFTFFFSWAFAQASPTFWEANIEPNLGLGFSTFLASLGFVVVLGYILAVGFHRYRVSVSLATFHDRVEASNDEHRSVQSLHGYDGLLYQLQNSMGHHTKSLALAVLSAATLIAVFWYGTGTVYGNLFLLVAASFLLLSVGQHLPTRSTPFNMVEQTGLLAAYTPPVHPSTLNMVFNDLIKTHMDPLLRSQYDEYTKVLEGSFKRGIDRSFAHEKFLMTLYRHATGLDRKTLESEMAEILTKKGMEHVFSNDTFTLEAWLILLGLINQRCPAFFRMVDRLKQDLEGGREPAMSDLIFEVDMENVVTDKANLFTLFHNLSDKTRTVVFRVQTPNFEPKDLALTYRLEPGEQYWWSSEALPLAAEGNEDVLGKMSGLLKDSTVSWQTLIPTSVGDATVSVRLEETNGELLLGRQINVRVRAEFRQWLRSTGTYVSYLFGGLGLVVASIRFVMVLLNDVGA
ncbi:MAG: hypothetical protein VXZ04_01965 [Candidatus Thermoplasmatota archaeon]|nr:hypothetical protein [Candidatus Thermoplasmatota archaeon]MEC8415394.1 hypothetical protein [Candidatus Thermoplasmatota archaeon]MEC8519470.1 hypothetical protein [Candidatus Thermoplasmatota archaeon]MED5319261.1 hypothetical protein [Candidatus Thermoplasmatota archaeon]